MGNEEERLLPGTFVRYILKDELGLVSDMVYAGARCWFHMGGTRAMTPYDMIEPITFDEVLSHDFSNEYCKTSLIERYLRIQEGRDVSDLIDREDVREEVVRLLQQREQSHTNRVPI